MTTNRHTALMESFADDVDDDLTVGQVAQTFGVTVRTLHHYDEIGLLTPSARSHAGYRLYMNQDLRRLATIVTYRRLGLALDTVAALLRGEGSPVEHLRRQRDVVTARVAELAELAAAIDTALEKAMTDQPATTQELKELFGDTYDESYAAEAEQRWGESDAWTQSQQRTKAYTQADWAQIKQDMEAVNAAFVAAKRAGLPPTSAEAMNAAEAARRHIHDRFYDLPYAMHRGLGDMYLADPRFAKTYEDLVPGLAAYVRDAIYANADRHDQG